MVAALRDVAASASKAGRAQAPTRETLRDVLDSLAERFAPVQSVQRDMDDLYWSAHPISLPDDIENPTYVYSAKAAQQLGLYEGILGNRLAQVRMAARATRSDEARAKVELLQDHTNRAFPRLEQQAGNPVGAPVVQDVGKYGWGVDNLVPAPRRIGRYGKVVADFPTADRYSKDRARFVARMGDRGGRLPLTWTHVPARNFMWVEDPEQGGLTLAVERRDRYVRDLVDDPRYRDSDALLKVAHDYRLAADGSLDKRRLGAQLCSLWTVQDRDWITQFITPPERLSWPSGASQSELIETWASRYDLGEIAYQVPNYLGRVTYTVTKGLRTSSPDPARALIGLYYHARHGIKGLDWALTVQACSVKDQAFAPWLLIPGDVKLNSQVVRPQSSPPAKRRIRIARGNGYVTELEPGTQIQQLIPKAPPDLVPFLQQVRDDLNLLLIPDSLLSAINSSSGYEYNSLRNTVLSRFTPILEGFELAMAQRADLYAAILAHLGETISVSAIEGDREVKSYEFDPRKYQDLDITLETKFEVQRPEDSMAQLQQAAFAVEKRLLDVATSRERYLGVANHDEINRAILLDEYRASPQVATFAIQKAAEQAGMTLDQEAAKANGGLDTSQLLNTHPELLRALAQRAQPGDPGYAAIQAAAQQAGMLPPTPASPDAAAPDGSPLPPGGGGGGPAMSLSPGGAIPGQMPALQTGPHLSGGFGGAP